MNIYEVVKKLTGPISSIGETNSDKERFRELENTIDLVDRLVFDIREAARTKDFPEASRAKIGRRATEFLDELRDALNDES
jgi:hypothetical protein